jgi:hypothetical protein
MIGNPTGGSGPQDPAENELFSLFIGAVLGNDTALARIRQKSIDGVMTTLVEPAAAYQDANPDGDPLDLGPTVHARIDKGLREGLQVTRGLLYALTLTAADLFRTNRTGAGCGPGDTLAASLAAENSRLEGELAVVTEERDFARYALDCHAARLEDMSETVRHLHAEIAGHKALAERRDESIADRDQRIERLEEALTDAHGVLYDLADQLPSIPAAELPERLRLVLDGPVS